MAGHVTSGSSSVVVGQTVNAQVSMDLAPSIPREQNADEMAVTSETFDVNVRQVIAVTGTTTPFASIELAQRMGAAGTFTQTIHPTQQLFNGNQGSRFIVQVIDYVSFGADFTLLEIEWGWDAGLNSGAGGGFVRVWDPSGMVAEYSQAGFIPMLAELKIHFFADGVWSFWYGSTYITQGVFTSGSTRPFKIKYVYYKVSGQPQSATFPAGHPANGQGWSRWMFAEAALTGNWHVFEPTWTAIPLDISGVQIGATPVNPTSISYVNNVPVANFVVPASAGIKTFRIRARYHFFQSSTLGWPYLDIPVTSGGSTPLVVNGPNPVTLEPGQQYTVTANYPTSELTFAAVGGGSFGTGATANVFTAPTDAVTSATCHFTVTRPASTESVNIGVNVPLRLTPGTFSMIGGATQVITANADIATWSSTGGTLSGSAARSRTYTAPAFVGNFTINAQTTGGALSANAIATVTSSGTAPTTELRLEPFAGLSVSLNATPVVQMLGDTDPALWAKVNNFSIDGATGHVKIQSNSAFAESFMAQCFDPTPLGTASIFEWAFNSTQQQSPGDTGVHAFEILGGTESATGYVASIAFAYNGTGDSWNYQLNGPSGFASVSASFTWTATAGIRVENTVAANGTSTLVWKFRASNAVGYSTIGTMTIPAANFQPRFVHAMFFPTVSSRSNNTIIFQKPTIVSGFVRWYRPNWTASRVDANGNVLGSYTVTPGEDTAYTSGQLAQTAAISCNAVGTCRVSASYPSGVSAANNVMIAIAAAGTGLQITAPAEGTTTNLAAGGTLTVTANDAPAALTYSCPGGTFGSGANKNIFTAGAVAGFYTLTVSRGSEVVTRQIRVLMAVTPSTSSLPLGGSSFLDVNTSAAISYSATGGTIQPATTAPGLTRLLYTAPTTAGTYTINVTSGINNATATVTVIASGTDPIVIENVEPLIVEPGSFVAIGTNYPPSETTYSATGGAFRTAQQKHYWDAPAQAGPYTLTVSHPTGGTDTIVATVPLRVTPKTPAAVGFGAQIQFAANFPTITWVTTSGSINAAGLWTAGTTPGTFNVQAQATIAGNLKTDNATVTVFGDALALNVPNAVTLQPGGTLTITSNYPTIELSFSATGGTFGTGPTANVYTAPANAGGYTITVIRGTQSANIAVTVPVVIAPASISMAQNTVQVFTCNADVNLWNATGGVLTDYAYRTVTYTAGTTPGTYQITAQTVLGNASAAITNTGAASVPISIAGPALVFLEPGGTYNVTTNKPVGTYSLTATGGTFEGNTYRAPQTGGPYTITATDTSGTGGGSDTLAVEVPFRITPANPTVLPGANQQFTLNFPPDQTTWTTSPASLITATGLWTAPFTQGVYTIRAIMPTTDATTTATVATVELVVYGPSSITLEPGAGYPVSANLPPRGLTYTAFGGSFDLYTYIAPEAAGSYYFTVSYQGQTVRIDVSVPLRIAPKEVRVEASQSVQFTINAPSASWSVAGRGTVSQTGFYTAPASGGLVDKVTATTSLGSDTATVLLVDKFPFDPSYAVVSNIGRRVALVEAEDGTPFGRAKGPIRGHWEFIFENRDAEEYRQARAFFNARFPDIPVLIHDADLDEFIGVYFDSELHRESVNICEINYSFRGREVYSLGSS